ncbi:MULTISPECIES: 2-oxoglutarate dehydrogenase, E2 component, dihydrolipoamide succinyltransferase [unclassified Arthrobacter]|uniref:2-oxoglutarate dehydrogenase, E2 component, dihydrolipoamide succinyltransferase n=1 Tax=unclassified Arthrobacter TaxID=235627 RepID=UPI002103AD46|nr:MULTISPECIES: 2-oxoglutarate dehydrogenase, E2 component, dihydrolipoamide succinyltransferase [unclassified Arthrobacter]MCQ1946634.1 2-oxoglutarate dehydrogenase, E2 component, dihydrolipoamide succinyltransferase [Arthrobacter sp. zg-Y1116]MCQ1995894.1 2-oxoglutarate dehydrogenase, E2 component, dihydrolipoamide succinyltransferase [Arthrobacter sp. zg-Y1171]UWX83027.1 2-oxoglutarate dehydrogenase, E2 component, dihydrolipoamide succinyltransferase [Arthrobacter sp. zg-Y1171]
MSETVNLPALGESVTEGTVTRWLKNVGDRVEVDEPLLEVSTDKVDTEIPSPVAGVIEEILVAEDETAEVGAALVRIGDGSGSGEQPDDGGSAANQEAPAEEAPAPAAEEAPAAAAPAEEAPAESGSGEGTEVTLPALGESVTEGTVTRWLKAVGDDVEMDEPLLEVSTDKVDTEIPSPVAGKLLEIRVNEDDTAEVGSVLAVIGSGAAAPAKAEPKGAEPVAAASKDEREAPAVEPEKKEEPKAEAPKQEAPKAEAPKQEAPKAEAPKQEAPSGSNDGGTYVTPLVRKLANEHGVDLSSIKGSGVAGRIRKQDVLEAAEAKKAASQQPAASAPAASAASEKAAPAQISEASAKLRGTTVKAPRIRQTIARRMRESLEESAQLTQVHEVDMTRIAALRQKAKGNFQQQNGAKLTFLPFIAKAVVEGLKQHPVLNASYNNETQEITYHDAEHLAIAVDTEKGLLVPVINDAGDLNITGLAKKIADVGSRTRNNKIGPDELSGGTFTITNIGSVGALFDTPIINQPQVGILGTGAIVKRPMVVTDAEGNDNIAIRSMMYLSLTYDHRLVDGADAGRFLQTLKARLEEGNFEADLGL